MERFFMATYFNNYLGCDEERFFIANDRSQVETAMSDNLYDYAINYFDYSTGRIEDDEDNEYADDGWDEYFEDCGYNIEEISPVDIPILEEEYGEIDWEDLT